MASFSDNVTKGIFPVVEKTLGYVGITCELDRLLPGTRQAFDLPATSTLCIRCVRPAGMTDSSWVTAFQRASDVINQVIHGGLHPLSATWLGGTEKRHLVLKQEPLEESLLQESPKILNHLAQQLYTNFKYAEESHYEENGTTPPYTLKFMPADESHRASVIRLDLVRKQKTGSLDWNDAKDRLKKMADEFIREEGGVFDVTVNAMRGIGLFYISLAQNDD
jgi:hypothetical protein